MMAVETSLFLIAGLGNPDRKYAQTRHNIGFMLVDQLASHWGAHWELKTRFRARIAKTQWREHNIILCQPLTYMNASGEALKPIADFFRVPIGHLLVLVDDADLEFGTLRFRPSGSSGGHHGLESVTRHLGSQEFPRLRMGIGRGDWPSRDLAQFVLARFNSEEQEWLSIFLDRGIQQIQCWLREGAGAAMNQFNGPIQRNKGT